MKITIIAAALPPALGGIGDYSARVAAELARTQDVTVLTGTPSPDPIPGVRIETVFSPDTPRSVQRIAEFVEENPPDWVLLQFEQFSYGKWGLNPFLPLAMRRIKKRCPQTKFAWMAHEDFVPVISWKFALMTIWQRGQFWMLGRTADVIFFSIDPWVAQYRGWFPGKPVVHLPVGSNMPRVPMTWSEARARLGITEDTLVFGLFGTAHSSRLLPLIRDAVEAAYDRNPNVLALYIGPHGKVVCEALGGLPVRAEGPFEAEEVSRRFAAMDIYLVPITGGVSTRRTSFMTALQHGIPTVSTFGPQTDQMLLAENEKAFLLADVNSPPAFTDTVLRLAGDLDLQKKIGQEGEQLYRQEFASENVSKRMLETFTAAQPQHDQKPTALKVAIIMPLAEQRGGGELTLWHLMQQGRNAGVEWVVIFTEPGSMVAQVAGLGIETHVIEAGRLRQVSRLALTVLRIATLLRRIQADAVVSWMSKSHLYGCPAAGLASIPAYWYQQGMPSKTSRLELAAALLPAQGILACSIAGARAQARMLPPRPLSVVYPGVELARFDPACLPTSAEARRRLGLPASGPLIGIVGRLQHWKGIHVLLEAMPSVLKQYPDAHCVVVGGPHALEAEYAPYLERRIEEMDLTQAVTLAGLQSNVPEWMQALDVFVHASDREPFGIVIIEAMALGKPVIAGNSGGPTEIITDGTDGLLTPFGDAPALAAAILRYLKDPALAHRLGLAARERALEFSTQSYATSFIAALKRLHRGKEPS